MPYCAFFYIAFPHKYKNALFFPVWIVAENKDGRKRRFSYAIDIKSRLDFSGIPLSDPQIIRILEALNNQVETRKEIIFTLNETSEAEFSDRNIDSTNLDNINLQYLSRRYSEIVENPFLAHQLASQHIIQLQQVLNESKLINNFTFIVSMLISFLDEEKKLQEEYIFLKLLETNRLFLAVSDDPEIGFQIPENDSILLDNRTSTWKKYLFEDIEISSMNDFERGVGDILEDQGKLLWWFRNKVNKNWYSIQGWRKNRIRPDFIAAKQSENERLEIVYILEAKGEQLLGNDDTVYKKKVLDIMTEQNKSEKIQTLFKLSLFPKGNEINEKAECYLLEQGEEEESIRRLF